MCKLDTTLWMIVVFLYIYSRYSTCGPMAKMLPTMHPVHWMKQGPCVLLFTVYCCLICFSVFLIHCTQSKLFSECGNTISDSLHKLIPFHFLTYTLNQAVALQEKGVCIQIINDCIIMHMHKWKSYSCAGYRKYYDCFMHFDVFSNIFERTSSAWNVVHFKILVEGSFR